MEITFKGKTAVVSGASRGIGRAIALKLSQCGAKVIGLARSNQDLETLKKEDASIRTITVDLSNWEATKVALKDIGPVDLLVNNAGLAILEPLDEVTEEHVDKLFAINVKAVINLTQLVIRNLKSRNVSGSIVNISSQASMGGLHDFAIYSATKGAVDSFTRATAVELGTHKIRVNAVNPTVIMTDMGRLGFSDPKKAKPMIDKIPLKRFGEVDEVVDAVLYLLSDRASMINGVCLPVDGGYLAG